MHTRLLTTMAFALSLMLPAAVGAQQKSGDSPATKSPQSQQTDTQSPSMTDKSTEGTSTTGASTDMGLTKDQLVGKTLYGADDEEVGEIQDVAMGTDGTVESVLIDVGGFLGIGGKTVAVPVDQVEMQGDKVMASGLTKEQAEEMPEHSKPQ